MSPDQDGGQGKPSRRTRRRVQRPGVPGSDPAPQSKDAPLRAKDDTEHGWNDGDDSNDARLRRDKPPHWG